MTVGLWAMTPVSSSEDIFERLAQVARSFHMREFRDRNGLLWRCRDTQAPGGVLLLLPGAAGGCDAAFTLLEDLGRDMRVIAVTYPSDASAAMLANGLAEMLDWLSIEKAAVWGSSYGAWWAQAFATLHSRRVSALWLGNTFVDRHDVDHLPLFDAAWLHESDAVVIQRKWLDVIGQSPKSDLRELQLHFVGRDLCAEDLRARLIRVATSNALEPSTAVGNIVVSDCADDALIRPATRDRVAQRYPQSIRIRLPAGGHYPHLTNTVALTKEMRRWLQLPFPASKV